MRKIILFNMITLDGFFEGLHGEIDWHNVDEEFNTFAIAQLDTAAGLIFGRVTYEMMASYWPSPQAIQDDPIVASKMNSIPKIVFSTTLEKVEWQNSRLVGDHIVEEILKLKEQADKDLYIFGSSSLASTLTRLGLIDEYRVMVNPIVIGEGKPLFKGIKDRLKLKLIRSQTFRSGNVLLVYQPIKDHSI